MAVHEAKEASCFMPWKTSSAVPEQDASSFMTFRQSFLPKLGKVEGPIGYANEPTHQNIMCHYLTASEVNH